MFDFTGNSAWKGILIGVGMSAVGFYVYKKNEDKVDAFLGVGEWISSSTAQTTRPCPWKN